MRHGVTQQTLTIFAAGAMPVLLRVSLTMSNTLTLLSLASMATLHERGQTNDHFRVNKVSLSHHTRVRLLRFRSLFQNSKSWYKSLFGLCFPFQRHIPAPFLSCARRPNIFMRAAAALSLRTRPQSLRATFARGRHIGQASGLHGGA